MYQRRLIRFLLRLRSHFESNPREMALLGAPVTPEATPTPEPSSEPLLDIPQRLEQEQKKVSVSMGDSGDSATIKSSDGKEYNVDIVEIAMLEIPELRDMQN